MGDTSYSQMTNDEKDRISHRGIALAQLQDQMAEFMAKSAIKID
ncbi:MAG: non-canonical purine NTP pyrophosphatase [Oscillospiraceae bacterium]